MIHSFIGIPKLVLLLVLVFAIGIAIFIFIKYTCSCISDYTLMNTGNSSPGRKDLNHVTVLVMTVHASRYERLIWHMTNQKTVFWNKFVREAYCFLCMIICFYLSLITVVWCVRGCGK